MVVDSDLAAVVRRELDDAARHEDRLKLLDDDFEVGVGVHGNLVFIDWTEGGLQLR